jgi:hypothetical protein
LYIYIKNKDETLNNIIYKKYFTIHLSKQYQVENIIFYDEIQIFKSIENIDIRIKRSFDIFNLFLKTNSKYELNLNIKDINYVKENLNFGNIYLFNNVLDQVLVLLIDCFIDFTKTNLYNQLFIEEYFDFKKYFLN